MAEFAPKSHPGMASRGAGGNCWRIARGRRCPWRPRYTFSKAMRAMTPFGVTRAVTISKAMWVMTSSGVAKAMTFSTAVQATRQRIGSPRSSMGRSTPTRDRHRRTRWRPRRCRATCRMPSSSAGVARADGGSSSNPNCTSARTSGSPTSRAGVGSECRGSPTPRTSPSRPTGCAKCSRARRARSACKRPIYAREGVAHLWLVEPTDRTLEAFELHDGQWLLIASAKDDEPVSIRPFDAITFSLGDLWP